MTTPAAARRPLVTVVIPCFNQGHYLGEAIESVLNQKYERVEIIVVNDGSSDDTTQIASSYPEVALIVQENQGLSAARNRGLEQSRGELLVFLDADDRLLTGALSRGVACLAEHAECAFAFGQFHFIHAEGGFVRAVEREPRGQHAYLDLLRTNRIGMHATVIYRRWVFDRIGAFNTDLKACEDLELYLRIARRFPVVEHPALVAEYRRHTESMSSSGRKMLTSVLAVLEAESRQVATDPERQAALHEGILRATGFYTIRLMRAALPPRINRRNWRPALADLWWLARSHPRGFLHARLWLPEIIERRKRYRRAYASA
jgi:glycosyltransferase involved in cell wall biosynthesis